MTPINIIEILIVVQSTSKGCLIMPEHQQSQKYTESKSAIQKQRTLTQHNPVSNPMAIIQRAKINPKSLTPADVMQLQRTIGNRAVVKLLSEIGVIPSKTKQAPPVQMQTIPEEEEKPLQGKMAETIQGQEIPGEEDPLQAKMIGTIQHQETPEKEEPLQGKFESEPKEEKTCPSCMQRQEIPEEEEPLQRKMIETVQHEKTQEEKELLQSKRENNTGMPDNLKAGVEGLSGINMSDVRVHYNSSKPAEVGALAYTQGMDIHIAPGQERHLPHEAWHAVQQKQGRVQLTTQMKGLSINDDPSLEHEADMMGAKTAQFVSIPDEEMMQGKFGEGMAQKGYLGLDTWYMVQQKNVKIPEPKNAARILQRKIEAKITINGFEFERDGELIRYIPGYELPGGKTYRHMAPKSLRASAGEEYLKSLLQADPGAVGTIQSGKQLLQDVQDRAVNWERFTEEKGDQFLGESTRNLKISDSYDSMMFEAIFTNTPIDIMMIERDAGALVRHYTYKAMKDGKTDALINKINDANNWPAIILDVRTHISTELQNTSKIIKLEDKSSGATAKCINAVFQLLDQVPNSEIALIKPILSGAKETLKDKERIGYMVEKDEDYEMSYDKYSGSRFKASK